MECIVSIGKPIQKAIRLTCCIFSPFQNQIGRSFAEIQPGPTLVKRATGGRIQNHQRFESIQREAAQRIGSTGHHSIRHTMPQ